MGTNNHSEAYGYNQEVDSSGWKQPVASHKGGEPQPAPAPVEQTETGAQRTPTPDPYTSDNPHVRRNFGRP
jgi:hypothetical protein